MNFEVDKSRIARGGMISTLRVSCFLLYNSANKNKAKLYLRGKMLFNSHLPILCSDLLGIQRASLGWVGYICQYVLITLIGCKMWWPSHPQRNAKSKDKIVKVLEEQKVIGHRKMAHAVIGFASLKLSVRQPENCTKSWCCSPKSKDKSGAIIPHWGPSGFSL